MILNNHGGRRVAYDWRDGLASHYNYVAYDIQGKDEEECADNGKEFVEAEAFGDLTNRIWRWSVGLKVASFGQHLTERERRDVIVIVTNAMRQKIGGQMKSQKY